MNYNDTSRLHTRVDVILKLTMEVKTDQAALIASNEYIKEKLTDHNGRIVKVERNLWKIASYISGGISIVVAAATAWLKGGGGSSH